MTELLDGSTTLLLKLVALIECVRSTSEMLRSFHRAIMPKRPYQFQFFVLELKNDNQTLIQVVPGNWYHAKYNQCYWPPKGSKYDSAITEQRKPLDDWKLWRVTQVIWKDIGKQSLFEYFCNVSHVCSVVDDITAAYRRRDRARRMEIAEE